MALPATVRKLEINLADSDRGVYEELEWRVAQHPSESERFLVARVLARALEHAEGMEFSKGGVSDDEMPALGISHKRARDLGHLPQSGPGGMLEWLERLPRGTRRILIHVNNTNPILDEESAQRAELSRRGIEVAWDGLEITL